MDPRKLEEKKDKKVYLIAGTINATGKTLYWRNEQFSNLAVGEYAIVNNVSGYDLIKITGILETTEKQARKFSNTEYNNMKEVVFNVGRID